jgi:hypothetical protein
MRLGEWEVYGRAEWRVVATVKNVERAYKAVNREAFREERKGVEMGYWAAMEWLVMVVW